MLRETDKTVPSYLNIFTPPKKGYSSFGNDPDSEERHTPENRSSKSEGKARANTTHEPHSTPSRKRRTTSSTFTLPPPRSYHPHRESKPLTYHDEQTQTTISDPESLDEGPQDEELTLENLIDSETVPQPPPPSKSGMADRRRPQGEADGPEDDVVPRREDDRRGISRQRGVAGNQRTGRDMVIARKFSGEEYEDVTDFIESIDISYSTVDTRDMNPEMVERTKVLYLSGNLRGEAYKWWSMLETSKRNTWTKAVNALNAKYGNEGARGNRAIMDKHKAYHNFMSLRQNGKSDLDYAQQAQDIFAALGDDFNRPLAVGFVRGIDNPVTRSVVSAMMGERERQDFDDVVKIFLAAATGDLLALGSESATAKSITKDNSGVRVEDHQTVRREDMFVKALEEVQSKMTKMMIENTQRIAAENNQRMMENNQQMLKMITTALGTAGPMVGAPMSGAQQNSNFPSPNTFPQSQNYSQPTGFPQTGVGIGIGRGRGRPPVGTELQGRGGPTCFNCGQRGHYRNECQEHMRQSGGNRGWNSRDQMGNVAPITPHAISSNAVIEEGNYQEGNYPEDDLEGSGTMGMKVSTNMVELVAAVGKRGRESSSSENPQKNGKPAMKRTRVVETREEETETRPMQEDVRMSPVQDNVRRSPMRTSPAGSERGRGSEGNSDRRTNSRDQREQKANEREDIEMRQSEGERDKEEIIPKNQKQKKKRKRRNPLEVVLRQPRMMEGEKQLNYVDIIKSIPVTLPFGHILTLSPAVRAGIAYGMIIPPKKKSKKGKGKKVDEDTDHPGGEVTEAAGEVVMEEVLSEPTGDMMNFYTEGEIYTEKVKTPRHITRILVDGGSVTNLVSDDVAREFSLPRCPNDSFDIRTVSGQLIPMRYFTRFYLTIAGVTAQVKAYIIPGKSTYNLLLGRRWMKQVRAGGNYEQGTYEIRGADGKGRQIPEYHACKWHKHQTPIVHQLPVQSRTPLVASANGENKSGKSRRPADEKEDSDDDLGEEPSDLVNETLQKVVDQIVGGLQLTDGREEEDEFVEYQEGRSSDDDGDGEDEDDSQYESDYTTSDDQGNE